MAAKKMKPKKMKPKTYTIEGLKHDLQIFADLSQGYAAYVLANGKVYNYAPLPKGIKHGQQKNCFGNAYELAKKKKWLYVEGYFSADLDTFFTGPIHHAWCADPKAPDMAIDPTVKEKAVYLGITFNLAEVAKRLKKGLSMLGR